MIPMHTAAAVRSVTHAATPTMIPRTKLPADLSLVFPRDSPVFFPESLVSVPFSASTVSSLTAVSVPGFIFSLILSLISSFISSRMSSLISLCLVFVTFATFVVFFAFAVFDTHHGDT